MPDVRDVLRSGDSAARLALLARISDDELTKDMDDSYLADFAAAAEDPDPAVRAELARVVCAAWIWRAGLHRISDPAVDLALRLSRDPDPDVRSQAVYHGLSTYRGERDDVLRRLVELALDPGEDAMHGRINWALERYEDRLASLLEADLRGDDRPRAHAVYALYRSVLKRRPPVIPDGIAGPADLLGTWRVTVESNGNPNLSVPPLTVVQDEHGALRLQRDNGEELGLDALAELLYAELGAVLNFSFHTQVEGTLLRSTGRLEGDRIQGSSRWDGGETLIIWSAQRLPE
ncbi:MAG: hypothetical protein DRQ55_15440 [Planctomycetota bacterium]|nr:MAG: hypothetical protein DRQ55_15440 [Planctomycetota bacterium]